MIRKYGYAGRDSILELVAEQEDLQENLSAAAHLILGAPEGRFRVVYAPGGLTRDEIEQVNFAYMDLAEAENRYNPAALQEGFNTVNGEEVYFVKNPGLGLWAERQRFAEESY